MNIFFKNHLSFTFDTITWNTRGTCITHVTSETRSALKQSKSNEIFIRNDIRRTYILSSKTWWTLKTWRAKWTGPALFNKLFRRKKTKIHSVQILLTATPGGPGRPGSPRGPGTIPPKPPDSPGSP